MDEPAYRHGDAIVESCDALFKVLRQPYRQSHCSTCFRKDPQLACYGCRAVRYCDEMCQIQDWTQGHRLACGSRTFLHCCQACPMEEMLVIYSLYLQLVCCPGMEVWPHEMPDGTPRSFSQLESNWTTWSEDAFAMSLCWDLANRLQNEGHNVQVHQLVRLFGICHSNAFTITVGEDTVGLGIYMECSGFDHSCRPTASCSQDGQGRLTIRALTDISSHARPTISYLRAMELAPVDVRRNLLRSRYCFECMCERCVEETLAPVDYDKLKMLRKRMDAVRDEALTRGPDCGEMQKVALPLLQMLRQVFSENDHPVTLFFVEIAQLAAITPGLDSKNIKMVKEECLRKTMALCGPNSVLYHSLKNSLP